MHTSLAVATTVATAKTDLDVESPDSPSELGSNFCSCRLLDPMRSPDDHLHDCELLLVEDDSEDNDEGGSEPTIPRSSEQRRRHRETMARIRHRFRTSITALKVEASRLDQELRDRLEQPVERPREELAGLLGLLRLAYLDLVREQIALQDERGRLETLRALREKYERLVQRELQKARIFGNTTWQT